MKKAILISLISVILVSAFVAVKYYITFYQPNTIENNAEIYIYENESYSDFLETLFDSNVLAKTKTFKKAADKLGLADVLKPGHYLVPASLTNKELIRIFANGYQTPINLVVKGYVRNWESMAAYFGERLQSDSTAFINTLRDEALMKELGFTKESYLGLMIPDTYEVWWTITPEDLLRRMKKEYDAFWDESRKAKAKAIGLTQDEVMTLASIVIEESKYEPEMPTIAGVYINRLNRGMKLQADPTVKYALNSSGITRILTKHLAINSPYNTYVYAGLPPGLITIAPKVAIDAVLNYQHHKYLYFCAKDTFDGQHNFAASYAEHLRNARAYQKALSASNASK